MATVRRLGLSGLYDMLGKLAELKANEHFFRGVSQTDEVLTVHLRRKCLPCGGEVYQMEVVVHQQPDRMLRMTLRSAGEPTDVGIFHCGLIAALGKSVHTSEKKKA